MAIVLPASSEALPTTPISETAPPMPPKPKLNILALPSYTALLFALIAFVILTATLASMLPASLLWWPPLVLGILLLTLRDYLRWPEREAHRFALEPAAGAGQAALQETIHAFAEQTNVPPPQVLVGNTGDIRSFGTFRRAFVGVDRSKGQKLTKYIADPSPDVHVGARAILTHELAHFVNQDVRRAGLSASLLRTTFWVALLDMWIAIGLIALLLSVGPEVTQQQFWGELSHRIDFLGWDLTAIRDELRSENPVVFDRMADPSRGEFLWFAANYQVTSLLPFIVSAAVLYLFLWRKLLRVREFYADARAAAIMGNARAVEQAHAVSPGLTAPTGAGLRLPRLLPGFRERLRNALHAGPLALHPKNTALLAALDDPTLAFGPPWQIGLWAGIAILFLELMLRGSLTIMYISQPGPHLPLLTATTVFAIWLLPKVCQGLPTRSLWRAVVQMAVVAFLVKLSVNFLDGLLVGSAAMLGQLDSLGAMLEAFVLAAAGAFGWPETRLIGGEFPWAQIVHWHIVSPIAYFTLFALPVLIVTLMLDAWLKRLALTWYPLDGRVRRVFWSITAVLVAVQALVVIPIGNRIFFGWIYTGWKPAVLAGIVAGLLVAVAAATVFAVEHRRHATRCRDETCQKFVSGSFEVGKRCPHCGTQQHPWLVAGY